MPPSGPGLWQRVRRAGGGWGIVLAVALWAGALAMDVWPIDPMRYRVGQYVPRDIHSRVAFKVLSVERRDARRREVAALAPARFSLRVSLADRVASELKKLPDRMKATTQPADLDAALKAQLGLAEADAQRVQGVMAAWRSYATEERRGQLDEHVGRLRRELVATYVVSAAEIKTQLTRPGVEGVVLVAGADSTPVDLKVLVSLEDREKIGGLARGLAEAFPEALGPSAATYLTDLLGRQATYACDEKLTQEALRRADEAILADPSDDCYAHYAAGKSLVVATRRRPAGQAPGLTAQELELLQREQEAYLAGLVDSEGPTGPWMLVWRIAGRACALAMIVMLLCVYTWFYENRVVRNSLRGLAVAATILLMLGANRILAAIAWVHPHACLVPVLLAAVILTIAYNQRFALMLGAVISALVVLQMRAGYETFILLLVAVAATVFQLDEIRTRSKLIRVLSISALLVFVTAWGAGMFALLPWRFILSGSLWAGLSTVLAGLVAQAVLPVIERVFRIATSMTLLEWCDASRLLMRRLAMESPGTHNHSLQLGSMCEAAAEAIGARGLLARVGAYYHDIGKINKPEYFSENESGSASKHAKLSPAMSLLIIIGHVKDGIELAREYALPPVLHEFIATHHGTTLVQYFYHAAAEQRKGESDRAPDEVEFRYPGPKPQSPEAGILMLADAAESSVRAMSEPTPGRIENQVHAMVSRRLMDGQLDDCELTLREVHQIETSLIKSLCGVYHSRIAYPTPAGEKPSAAEMPPRRPDANGGAQAPEGGANGIKARQVDPPPAAGDAGAPAEGDQAPAGQQ